jgi:hypothetical protein
MRLRQGDELVVGVDRLGPLAGEDVDGRERRHQAAGTEHAVDDREHVRVDRDALEALAVDQQVVDAERVGPLEAVAGRPDVQLPLQAVEVLEQPVHELRLDGVLDDRVAVTGHTLDVPGHRLDVHAGTVPSARGGHGGPRPLRASQR